MNTNLEGKVGMVTGAASGIGRATALALAREGAEVVVSDIDTDGGKETVRMIKEKKGEAIFIEANVASTSDIENMFKEIVSVFGRLDCAVNNAGLMPDIALLADGTEENWDRIIDVNLKGVWSCMKYEIRQMLKQEGGTIVNIASTAGFRGFPNESAYVASKHGVVGLTKAAAIEYARQNIRVNSVCPGATDTKMFGEFKDLATQTDPKVWDSFIETIPMGRVAEPAETAEAALWLCSDAATYVTGQIMPVDGGLTT